MVDGGMSIYNNKGILHVCSWTDTQDLGSPDADGNLVWCRFEPQVRTYTRGGVPWHHMHPMAKMVMSVIDFSSGTQRPRGVLFL